MPRGAYNSTGFLADLANLGDAGAEDSGDNDAGDGGQQEPPAKPAAAPSPSNNFDTRPLEEKLDVIAHYQRQEAEERRRTEQHTRQQQNQPKQYARTRGVYDDEFYGTMDAVTAKQQELDERLAAQEQREREWLRGETSREDRSFQQAVSALKKKYSNFDENVPASIRQKAVEIAKSGRQFGQDWEGELEAFYWRHEGPKQHARDQDEVGKKRQQSGQQRSAPASVPRGGGGGYQAPEQPAEHGRDKGYRRARGGFLADLKNHFGG